MINVTIRFGATTELTKELPNGTTVGGVLNDRNLQSVIGFGSNVQGVVDGQVQRNETTLVDGDELTIETKANSKA